MEKMMHKIYTRSGHYQICHQFDISYKVCNFKYSMGQLGLWITQTAPKAL